MGALLPRLRLWIGALALGSFAAGLAIGSALPTMVEAHGDTLSRQRDYVDELGRRYQLTADQRRSLRLVLQHDRDQEVAILRNAEWSQLPPALLNRLLASRNQTEQRIRAVLDERQRALYDRDSRPDAAGGESAGGALRR